jgi:hypothetical protein
MNGNNNLNMEGLLEEEIKLKSNQIDYWNKGKDKNRELEAKGKLHVFLPEISPSSFGGGSLASCFLPEISPSSFGSGSLAYWAAYVSKLLSSLIF